MKKTETNSDQRKQKRLGKTRLTSNQQREKLGEPPEEEEVVKQMGRMR